MSNLFFMNRVLPDAFQGSKALPVSSFLLPMLNDKGLEYTIENWKRRVNFMVFKFANDYQIFEHVDRCFFWFPLLDHSSSSTSALVNDGKAQ